jgi:hypothetical protein
MLPFEMLALPVGDTRVPASARQQVLLDSATAETIRTRPLEEQDLCEAGMHDCRDPLHQEWSTSETRPVQPLEESTVTMPFEMLGLPHGFDTDEDE